MIELEERLLDTEILLDEELELWRMTHNIVG